MQRDPLRLWVVKNIHTLAFLGSYFLTVVAGNLIFASPLAGDSLRISHSSGRFLEYPQTFTLGYWALLLCPFVLTPLIVAATRRASRPWVGRVAEMLPEFRRVDYALICVAVFGFVIYRFWQADVVTLLSTGVDFKSSVEARFAIRARIGFITLAPLQALLPFLTLYALIRWIQKGELFWMALAVMNTFLLSVLLIMINMKWPVLLFYVGIVLAIFVYARKHAYVKTAVGAVLVFIAFIVISAFVFRIAPSLDLDRAGAESRPVQASEYFVATGKAVPSYVPNLLVIALNRMAISYPYYYQVFTQEGPLCGGILGQATRDPICRPSELIYSRIFVDDAFQNRGTSPLSVHISGYALGGWPVAMLALFAGSIILGLFAAVPLDRAPATGTATIIGAQTAYHLSQIPGEGIIFYEHGLIWIALMMIGYVLWRRLASSPKTGITANTPTDYVDNWTKASR